VCVCVCVCVYLTEFGLSVNFFNLSRALERMCVGERERERVCVRERERESSKEECYGAHKE